MNILLIGFDGPDQTCSMIEEGLRDIGHSLIHYVMDIPTTKPTYLSEYYYKQDLVIVFQTNCEFINDVEVPVIYYHPEILSPASLDKWDYLVAGGIEITPFLMAFNTRAMQACKATLIQNYGVILQEWTPLPKSDMIPFFIGNLERDYAPHWLHKIIYSSRQKIIPEITPLINLHPAVPYDEYKTLLARSVGTIIIHGEYCYLSQRIFEAAAMACCPIIYTGNSLPALYESLGLIHGYNCLFFDSYHDLKTQLSINLLEVLGKRARKWVEKHTHLHRAKELIDWYSQCKLNEQNFTDAHAQKTHSLPTCQKTP